MPTYEYRCQKGHEFEQFQRMSDEPVSECPECGAPAERLLSAGGGLLFKGSGFYITDYRSDSYKKAAEKDKGGGSASATSGAGKDAGAKSSGGASGGASGGGSKD
jgi:putative FmdB family regulatory protein